MDIDALVIERREGAVAWITLNRPDQMNTVTPDLFAALAACVERARNDETVRCVVLTGAGRAFCAGRDLKADPPPPAHSAGDWLERRVDYLRRSAAIAQSLHEMPKPTIAMINGACAGAGLSLAGACDLRIAASDAVMTSAFVKAGLSGDMGGTWFWSRILGASKARRLYLMSERFRGEAAEAFGLVDRAVAPELLGGVVAGIAQELSNCSARALRFAKASLNAAEDGNLEATIEFEAMGMAMAGIDAAAAAGEIAG